MADESFGKERRLLKSQEYKELFNKGWRIDKRFFVIYGLNRGDGITRVGISVPSRVVRAAVKRNRIKRLLREVFRKNKEMLAVPSDIVIVAKRGAEGLSYKNIEDIFLKLKIDINHKE